MKVLVACEMSGIVRDAFRAKGHEAMSCDVLCCMRGPAFHYRQDVREILSDGWDLMIAHPPCTFLSYAATSSWNKPGRAEKREAAMRFFMELYEAKIERIAIENPTGWPNTVFRKPNQIVNPFDFGDRKRKRICLWLKNLPLLIPINSVAPPDPTWIHNRRNGTRKKNRCSMDALPPSPTRGQKRSIFFPGIAAAMADQWGNL